MDDDDTAVLKPDPSASRTGDEAAAAARPVKRRGGILAGLSLLLALAALAAVGYLYYQLVYLQPEATLDERLGNLERAVPSLERQLNDLQQAQASSLETLAAEQRDSLAEAKQSMIAALNEVSNQAPPAPREWKLAEVEYLLRIANQRVLMERDVDSALKLLKSADAILQELDDFALFQVRAALADEILALGAVQGNDVQGIYLRLEAVKGRLADLPLGAPEYLRRVAQPAAEAPTGVWQALKAEFSSYFKLRRFEGSAKPLLAPEEGVYLELNLRLMMERGQLAALRRQQIVYEQSLATARDWISRYLDPDDADVKQAVAELEALLAVKLDQPLPDISGSLKALQQVRRGGG